MADKKKILYLLDADPSPSPFDINVGYDAGFDVVVPFGGVKSDKIGRLIEDAMFSRGVDGAACTKIFLNGNDLTEVRNNLIAVRKAMVPPFELAVFVDPRGGYTTGASMVAQVNSYLEPLKNKKSLKECNVIVFGGTGPVGQVVCILCAQQGAKTTIVSREKAKAEKVATELKALYNVVLIPDELGDEAKLVSMCKDKDIIFTCGTAGAQMISVNVLKKLPTPKILADVNAVPPLGIEGIDVNKKNKEHKQVPGMWFHGALSVGDVKLKVEKKGLEALMTADGKKTFDFSDAFQTAMAIYAKKKAEDATK
jgi:methylene-tetrahydromethanopterin dehydrogenase